MKSGLRNNVRIEPNKNKPLAKSEVDWIRTTTIETRNIYRFGAANKIIVLEGTTDHTIKKVRRENKKPKKLNIYVLSTPTRTKSRNTSAC